MSIQAAQRMGLRCVSLDPGSETPASQIAAALQGELGDVERVRAVFEQCDFITLENEFIPASVICEAGGEGRLVPGVQALATIQDKLLQRQALIRAGVPS